MARNSLFIPTASWHVCLTSTLLGWTTLELGGHEAWAPLPSRALYQAHGLLKSRIVSLYSPLKILNSIISQSLQSRLLFPFTSPTIPSLVNTMSNRATLLVGSSVIWMSCRQCLSAASCIAYVVLCCSFNKYQCGLSITWGPGPSNDKLLLFVCRGPHVLLLPGQVAYRRHAL